MTSAGDPAALTEQDKPTVFEQYEQLAELMLKRDDEGKPFTFYHYMIDLAGGPCIYKRISGCGSGTEYMAVTPWGDLYPAINLSGMINSCSETFGRALQTPPCAMNSPPAMFMRARSAATAGQGSIAPAAVPQMRIIPRVPFAAFTNTVATCSAKGWNAR